MKSLQLVFIIALLFLASCSSSGDKKQPESTTPDKPKPTSMIANPLDNKGIGPIKSIVLADAIDAEMAAHGKEVYEGKCTACHKATEKFIGPAPKGILERRSPEWVMNMILNPEEMTQKDPDAKKLLMEFNGSPMANQNLTEDEARAVLEYFRTL